MGDHLTALERTEEAGAYYQKALEANEQIYNQIGTTEALQDLISSYDKTGDNKHSQGLCDEAHAHRSKALELFEKYVKLVPSAEKDASYYSNKANQK
jgi:tetratricopeptide (TPR) repeat protein